METKKCFKCGIEKNICEFHKHIRCKFGVRSTCKECLSSEDEKIKRKEYYHKNIEKKRAQGRKSSQKRKDKKIEYDKIYREKNKDKKNEYIRNYRKNRRLSDPVFKITESMRSRLIRYFKSNNLTKHNKTFNLVGITPENLRHYLESKFLDGMNWDNYGEWHIDHIIPLSLAKTEDDLNKLCHFTNLQPLWGVDNIKKSNKIN
jgi:hypothetical protein